MRTLEALNVWLDVCSEGDDDRRHFMDVCWTSTSSILSC